MNTKIIAMYLPQFHCIPENDEFWGKGFTDWVSVKKAKPVYKGQIQPRIPLNANYYDLSEKKNVAWQAKLAKEYGIDGFGIYHYWFNNEKNLLTKPAEIIRDNRDIDIDYLFVWDNANWARSWSAVGGNDWSPLEEKEEDKKRPGLMVEYILGNEKDWENHFNYLLPFFKDERYTKKDNKPVFMVFNYSPEIERMGMFWDKLAKKCGFAGMFMIYRYNYGTSLPSYLNQYEYQPHGSSWRSSITLKRVYYKIKNILGYHGIETYSYDAVWRKLLKTAQRRTMGNFYHGGFVGYDDTPRRGDKAKIIRGQTPEKFGKYMKKLIQISKMQNKEFIFVTAWNEWGEGAYLEPDARNKYAYLNELRNAKL